MINQKGEAFAKHPLSLPGKSILNNGGY